MEADRVLFEVTLLWKQSRVLFEVALLWKQLRVLFEVTLLWKVKGSMCGNIVMEAVKSSI